MSAKRVVGKVRPQWAVLIGYLLLAVIMTWPLVLRLGEVLPGSDADAWVHLWTFNWVKESLLQGESPLFTRRLFYPEGVSLLFHNIAWVNIALWLPLQVLVGEAPAYSLLVLFVLVANGFTTYLLARDVTGSHPAAAVSGLVVAFWPAIASHNNHPNLIFIAWVPLALLFLRRTVLFGRRHDALLAGVSIGLLGITRYQLLVIAGFLIGFYLLYLLISEPLAHSRQRLRLLLLTVLVSLILVGPFVTPVVVAQVTRTSPDHLLVDEENQQTDPLAYFVPSYRHPLWGDSFDSLYHELGVQRQYLAFAGVITLLLAVYGVKSGWPESRVWLLAALLHVLLALGSELRVYGQIIALPLPYDLFEDNLIGQVIRRPHRLNVILSIPVALLAGMGVAALWRRLPRGRASLATLFLAFLILADYAGNYTTLPLAVPAWYRQLAAEPGEFALLSIPMIPRGASDKLNMMYQLTHGKALVEGHVSRPPEEAFAFIERVPMLSQLRDGKMVPDLPNPGHQLALLSEANVRYLIVHADALPAETVRAWSDWLLVTPHYSGDSRLIYRTDVEVGRDVKLLHSLLQGQSELGVVRTTITPAETTQSGWIELYVDWAAGTALDERYDACFALHNDQLQAGANGAQCFPLSAEWPTDRWQPGELVHARYLVQIDPFFPAGNYAVRLTLRDEQAQVVGAGADIGEVQVEALPREFIAPTPENVVDAEWEEKIGLVGYDLARSQVGGATLVVTNYWHARQPLSEAYKFFLHLIDPATGQVVAQADWVPQDWLYPTFNWRVGEYVEDAVQLDLDGVPAGRYQLFAGIYEPGSGRRLEPSSPGRRVVDNSLLLQEVTVD